MRVRTGFVSGALRDSIWHGLDMPVTIRQATTIDAEPILAVFPWLFSHPGSEPPAWDEERALAAIIEAIEDESSAIFIAISSTDASIAGFCSAYVDLNSIRYGRRCWVEDLAVSPDHRSRGIGDDLLDAAGVWATGRGATHLELDTGSGRTDAMRFYEGRNPQGQGISYQWRLDS